MQLKRMRGTETVRTTSNINYVKDGILHTHVPAVSVLVQSAADLTGISDNYEPGTIAHTAGYQNMWELSVDGSWTEI